jgi:hypothetical protein
VGGLHAGESRCRRDSRASCFHESIVTVSIAG